MASQPTYVQMAQEEMESGCSGPVRCGRDWRVQRICHIVGRQVAAARGVTLAELLTPSRSRAKVAAARQVAMYLSHTLLSATMAEVGRAFGRDRKTVSHACSAVEDQRDDRATDEELAALECIIVESLAAIGMHPGEEREVRDARH